MRTILFVGALALATTGCSLIDGSSPSDVVQEVGEISMPLLSESTSGALYRLDIEGSLYGGNEDDELDFGFYGDEQESVYMELVEGSWQMVIHGFSLQRMNEETGEFESVSAEMVTSSVLEFSIDANETTFLVVQFQTVDGDTTTFEEGGLAFSFTVDDDSDSTSEDHSIRSIKTGGHAFGDEVTITNVVATSGITENGSGFFVQDEGGGAYSGMFIYVADGFLDVETGDVLNVTGTFQEYYGLSEITVEDPTLVEFTGLGAEVEISHFYSPPEDWEPYESQLVSISDVTVTSEPSVYGEVTTDFGDLLLDDLFFEHGLSEAETVSEIVGPLYFSHDAMRINPRSADDIAGAGHQDSDACSGFEDGTEVGECAVDFAAIDQNGRSRGLYDDFAGNVIVLQIATTWDGASRAQAEELNAFYNEYADLGVEVVTVLVQNNSGENPEVDELAEWVDMFGLDHTVLADEDLYIFSLYNSGYSVPSYAVIGRDMRIRFMDWNTSIETLFQEVEEVI